MRPAQPARRRPAASAVFLICCLILFAAAALVLLRSPSVGYPANEPLVYGTNAANDSLDHMTMQALRMQDGALLWQTQGKSILQADNLAFVLAGDGTVLHALCTNDGREAWHLRATGTSLWKVWTAQDKLIAASQGPGPTELDALDTQGTIRWQTHVTTGGVVNVVTMGDTLYVTVAVQSTDQQSDIVTAETVLALRASDGTRLWERGDASAGSA